MTDKIKKPKQKLELTWIGKDVRPRLEPRILLPDYEHSHHATKRSPDGDCFDNKLIYGDNLLVLKSLEQDYSGKVKCVYIDPPYNTGSAFEHYDDGLEHSIWLGMMRDRLELLRNLLAEDGVILVQIDKNESAYLKVLMDEIFGRNAYVTTISIRMSKTSGFKIEHADKTIVKNTEYIHVYAKGKFSINIQYELAQYDSHYSYILDCNGNDKIMKSLVEQEAVRLELQKYGLNKSSKSLVQLYDISNEFRKFVKANKEKIGRTHTAPTEAINNKEELMPTLPSDKHVIDFTTKSGEKYLLKKTVSTLNQYIPISLKFNLVDSYKGYNEGLTNILGDWWDDFYLDMGNVENEGGVYFKASKKPERLLFRIFNMFTKEGDLVLDSFAGSGTTGAVAHKMKRKWIMVELGDHCHTHIVPRMKQVVAGTDKGGISESVGWQGGGGFRAYKLAPSMLKKDGWGYWIIDRDLYNADMLAEAMCKHMGFKYAPDDTHYWMHGRAHENSYIYVTTQTMVAEQLHALNEYVGNKRSLLVCCSAFIGADDIYKNLTIKKIPDAVLKNCEWGCDSYSLGIQGLPIAEADLKTDLFNEKEENNG